MYTQMWRGKDQMEEGGRGGTDQIITICVTGWKIKSHTKSAKYVLTKQVKLYR